MTVSELIEKLSNYPGGTVLTLSGDYGYGAQINAWSNSWDDLGLIWEED